MAFIKISALPESTTTTDLALAGVETGVTVKMSNSIGSAQVVTALGFTPAPLASPTFTGTPAAPTPTGGDNTTKLATTAFVQGAITGIGGAAAWGHITGTLASQTDLGTALALKAPLASPALTGTPTAPTAMLADNSTTVATTAFLKGQGYQPGIQFKDEGTNIGTLGGETIVNFVGAGVTGTASTGTITVTIPGGVGTSNAVTTLAIVSGVVNIDLSLGDLFDLSLTANVTSITYSSLPGSGNGQAIFIRMKQDATGGRTVALPASWKAVSGSDVAVQSAANAYTMIAQTSVDNGTRWEYVMKAGTP